MDKNQVRSSLRSLGMDLVGVAPAAAFATLPTWARSAIVTGMAVLDEAFDLEIYVETESARRWSKWAYERLAAASARMALALVAEGWAALPLAYEDSLSLLDLKAAAVRAGLGIRGLNQLVVNRTFGPRLRFGAVITSLELPADEPLADYYCVSCSRCLAACPTGALSESGLDRSRCIAEFAPDAAMVKTQKQMLRFPTPHTRLQCAACSSACPIGRRLPTRFWGLDPR